MKLQSRYWLGGCSRWRFSISMSSLTISPSNQQTSVPHWLLYRASVLPHGPFHSLPKCSAHSMAPMVSPRADRLREIKAEKKTLFSQYNLKVMPSVISISSLLYPGYRGEDYTRVGKFLGGAAWWLSSMGSACQVWLNNSFGSLGEYHVARVYRAHTGNRLLPKKYESALGSW